MIDLMNVAAYRENNRIEAKKALGGLPRSIWETYSAFANALGGVILLGVEEHKDTSLSPVDLPDPEGMVRQFWALLKDGKTVSTNILTEESVRITEVDGKHIIAIEVPRARRSLRPVYIGGDPMTGTYRRNGEGDYRCKREEVLEMQRDAARQTGDMCLLQDVGMDALNDAGVAEYLACTGDDAGECAAALVRLGAAGELDGVVHPTAAGLLLLGKEAEIRQVYPGYSLEYRSVNHAPDGEKAADAVNSGCNVFDFYNRVIEQFSRDFEPGLLPALREALTNCLLNADYHGGGVEICRSPQEITFVNAGQFRVDVETAVSGGVSDPRNLALSRLFARMGVGQGNGSGLTKLLAQWRQKGWGPPTIRETFAPARVTVRLPLAPAESLPEPDGKLPHSLKKSAVLAYITERIRAEEREVADCLRGDDSGAVRILEELMAEGVLVKDAEGAYRLKR